MQHADLAFALHLDRGFLDGVEKAAHVTFIVGDGAVRKGEVRLFRFVAALDEKLDVLHPRRRTPGENATGQRTGEVPDFGPEFRGGYGKGRMFVPEDGTIGVVVEVEKIG